MKVVITSATEKEIQQIKQKIDPLYFQENSKTQVSFQQSGVGILSSSFAMSELIFNSKPDLIIQAGIAGSFNEKRTLGEVVTVKNELLADTGVEENGAFKDLFDLNFQEKNVFPFQQKFLINHWLEKINYLHLDEVTGISVNEITTRRERIEQIQLKYHAEIESMEGASLHYCCLKTSTPFIQIRAISNYIGERDKTKWKFKEAFDNLSDVVIKYLDCLPSK